MLAQFVPVAKEHPQARRSWQAESGRHQISSATACAIPRSPGASSHLLGHHSCRLGSTAIEPGDACASKVVDKILRNNRAVTIEEVTCGDKLSEVQPWRGAHTETTTQISSLSFNEMDSLHPTVLLKCARYFDTGQYTLSLPTSDRCLWYWQAMKKVDRGNYVIIKSDSYYDAPSSIGYGGEMSCDLK